MKMKPLISLLVLGTILLFVSSYDTRADTPESVGFEAVRIEAKKGGYRLIDLDALWIFYHRINS